MSKPKRKRGFTLVEALASLTILAAAGAAILLAAEAATVTAEESQAREVAAGIAQQFMDACMGLRFAEQGQTTRATLLGRDAGESATPLQSVLFDDIDDWNGYFASPPDDPWGLEIGQGDDQGSLRDPSFRLPPGYLWNWYVSVAVCYADSSDFARVLPAGETSAFRAVIVSAGRVETNGTRRLLAELRRVCGDVATP